MHVSVNSSIDRISSDARESISQMIQGTLARFSSSISQVRVQIIDENGPRGGEDKICRVNLMMPGLGLVTASAKHEKVMAAVAEAARRTRRIVVAKLKRRQDIGRRAKQGRLLEASELLEV
ncbi:hypothetical protein [Planctomycetes bacterium K23_9]|uniref:Sigma 54 modulation protein / S30EA ribosomal protein n=1 Tax=Stieleria marina TaxID=1930275 RepID=A0A517NVI2_9BACT|nr:hypothetical protein K239x_31340 [Planctomycetes bacterium K23_9]